MKIKIYQINLDRDEDGVAFEALDMLEKYQHKAEVNAELYDLTFEGTVKASDLEDVYRIFNIEKPDDFSGRSLSISDIVEVAESEDVKTGFYYCDSIGFKEISFDSAKITSPEPQLISVVLCRPGELAEVRRIGTSLPDLQKAVGGFIEAFYPFTEEVAIVCNEEGKFNGMSPCRAVYNEEDGKIMDIIFGPFFICDCSGDNFGSLSPEQLERYTEMFRQPERFYRVNGELHAVKYNPLGGERA